MEVSSGLGQKLHKYQIPFGQRGEDCELDLDAPLSWEWIRKKTI